MLDPHCKICRQPLRYAPGPLTFEASHSPATLVAGRIALRCDDLACEGSKPPNWVVLDLDEARKEACGEERRGNKARAEEIRDIQRRLGFPA